MPALRSKNKSTTTARCSPYGLFPPIAMYVSETFSELLREILHRLTIIEMKIEVNMQSYAMMSQLATLHRHHPRTSAGTRTTDSTLFLTNR
jgi:hypothetical protein